MLPSQRLRAFIQAHRVYMREVGFVEDAAILDPTAGPGRAFQGDGDAHEDRGRRDCGRR